MVHEEPPGVPGPSLVYFVDSLPNPVLSLCTLPNVCAPAQQAHTLFVQIIAYGSSRWHRRLTPAFNSVCKWNACKQEGLLIRVDMLKPHLAFKC